MTGRWVVVGAAFLGLLAYLTLSLAPDSPPADAPHTARGATESCQNAVRSGMERSDFTLSPTVEYSEAGRYAVSGVVDGQMSGTEARRNYDCLIRYVEREGYVVDSVSVWQSH